MFEHHKLKCTKHAETELFMQIPNDPVLLLSYINTQLRDFYPSFQELCSSLSLDSNEIIQKLAGIQYFYDASLNKFV